MQSVITAIPITNGLIFKQRDVRKFRTLGFWMCYTILRKIYIIHTSLGVLRRLFLSIFKWFGVTPVYFFAIKTNGEMNSCAIS